MFLNQTKHRLLNLNTFLKHWPNHIFRLFPPPIMKIFKIGCQVPHQVAYFSVKIDKNENFFEFFFKKIQKYSIYNQLAIIAVKL